MKNKSPEERRKNRVTFNGVNGLTGHYGIQPLSIDQLVKDQVASSLFSKDERDAIKRRKNANAPKYSLASLFGDPSNFEEAGWGIVFPATAQAKHVDAILDALSPLIEIRQNKYFKILRGLNGYLWDNGRGQSFLRFLQENETSVGPVNPNQLPYYLLLIGDPQSIPYQFQYDLDVQYVVGRIYFDNLEDYYNYAVSVVEAENGLLKLPRKMAFFGPRNPGDDATYLSNKKLIKPLVDFYQNDSLIQPLAFQVDHVPAEQSNKQRLAALLGGDKTPVLLFTASHGVEWPYGHESQLPYQGALLCQDWPGPYGWDGKLDEGWFFSGKDISSNKKARLHGLIAFLFACYSAGTPYWDEFAGAYNQNRQALSERPFLSELPKAMLSHPNGGALAVIGHVERACSYSFEYDDGGVQLEAFKEVINHLMQGHPVGLALNAMNERYTTFASSLIQKIDKLKYFPELYSSDEIAFEWISANDAKGYMVLGDPAVRLPLCSEDDVEIPRVSLELNSPKRGELPEVLDPSSRPDPEWVTYE